MTTKTESEQFERLVARIEEAAAGRNATVKSPDFIPDSVTGEPREVDASIRFNVGTVPFLVVIECRKRSRKEDVRWIEELATKRDSVKADKIVAVSELGFSKSASRVAKHHGIELRRLAEVSPVKIDKWFLPPGGVTNVFRVIEDVKCLVGFYGDDGLPEEGGFPVKDAVTPVFYSELIESPFPAQLLVQVLEQEQAEKFWRVPLDGTQTNLTFTVQCTGGWLEADTSKGRRKVAWLSFSLLVSYETRSFGLKEGAHHIYAGAKSGTIQVSSFESPLFGGEAKFEFQSNSSGEIDGRLQLLSKNSKSKA